MQEAADKLQALMDAQFDYLFPNEPMANEQELEDNVESLEESELDPSEQDSLEEQQQEEEEMEKEPECIEFNENITKAKNSRQEWKAFMSSTIKKKQPTTKKQVEQEK